MAKQIIILDSPITGLYNYALWAAVPVARQPFYANQKAASVWLGASPSENSAISAGAVAEKVDSISVPTTASLAQIEVFLQERWTDWQSTITNTNHWSVYGMFWDGTTWTNGGVA